MASLKTLKCIQAQLNQLQQYSFEDRFLNVQAGPIDDKDLTKWQGLIFGPEGSPYQDGVFQLSIDFPIEYPFKSPKIRFLTPIYHPNIDQDGKIKIDILGIEWGALITITKTLLCISALLNDPDPTRFLPTIGKIYQNDKCRYQATAREWTKRFAQ